MESSLVWLSSAPVKCGKGGVGVHTAAGAVSIHPKGKSLSIPSQRSTEILNIKLRTIDNL